MRASFEVDIQNDFMKEDGLLSIPNAMSVFNAIKTLNKKAEFVIATGDSHIEKDAEMIVNGGPFPLHCMKNTDGEKRVDGLTKPNVLYTKSQNSIGDEEDFTDSFIRLVGSHHITIIDIYGVATEYCVLAAIETLLSINSKYNLGLNFIIWEDAIKGIDEVVAEEALKKFRNKVRFPNVEIKKVFGD